MSFTCFTYWQVQLVWFFLFLINRKRLDLVGLVYSNILNWCGKKIARWVSSALSVPDPTLNTTRDFQYLPVELFEKALKWLWSALETKQTGWLSSGGCFRSRFTSSSQERSPSSLTSQAATAHRRPLPGVPWICFFLHQTMILISKQHLYLSSLLSPFIWSCSCSWSWSWVPNCANAMAFFSSGSRVLVEILTRMQRWVAGCYSSVVWL